jgi:hypothetical protein
LTPRLAASDCFGEDRDELMTTWASAPKGNLASIYRARLFAIADSTYVKHRLSAIDANTIQFTSSNVTFVPVPTVDRGIYLEP